jgi:hypothetical protein
MDLSTLVAWVIIGTVGLLAVRPLASSLGRSSAVMGSLFVPYDRTLPWPVGVQETDEPWAWRDPPAVDAVTTGPLGPVHVGRAPSRGPRARR